MSKNRCKNCGEIITKEYSYCLNCGLDFFEYKNNKKNHKNNKKEKRQKCEFLCQKSEEDY